MIRLSLSSRLKPVALVLMLVTGSPAVAGAAVNTATLITGSASPSCISWRVPCGGKIRQIRFEVQHSQLRDPILIQELQDFSDSCYSRAYYRLKITNQSLTDKTINSVSWIGSDYFLNTEGYYDTYTSKQPRRAWPWNEKRDAGYSNTGDGGYPTCKEWWSDPKKGLKDRVLASLPSQVKADFQLQNVRNWQELALRWLVSPRNVSLSGGSETYMTGSDDNASGLVGNITRLATTVGVGMKQFEALPGFDALKQALPIVQALLEMMVIIAICPCLFRTDPSGNK